MTMWDGDTGRLAEDSRRALLQLLKGPYLSGRVSPKLWAALQVDEAEIRSRLHELFLDLVIDPFHEFAFTRKAATGDVDVPSALRSERMSFLDTVMVLALRQVLLLSDSGDRAIVGTDEINEQLSVYRTGDEATFARNLNASWERMRNKYRFVHEAGEGRVEISPVIRFLFDVDHVRALAEVYELLAKDE